MVEGNLFNNPLSPPTSPRMNQYHAESIDSPWQDHKHLEATPDSSTGEMTLVHSSMPGLDLDNGHKSLLHSHKSFPYPLRTSGVSVHDPDTPPLNSSDGSPNSANPDGLGIVGLSEVQQSEMATVTFGGSAPASPMSNMSADSPTKEEQQDLNGLHIDMDELIEERDENSKPMTAAEIRAHKRKMKRFRLTHNQTRFLMSEFARQAHPDAAHRERLAREIPGLSPRQVQVWFQNRRAKLKRLTSDDRERMMRSRALPDDFDMTQALHSPFGAGHGVGNSLNSPSNYQPAFPEGNMIRPLSLDTLRRVPDHMSPSGITPAFGGFNFTPPQSVTDTLSPVSPAGDSPFSYSPTIDGGPRRNNPFAGGVPSPSTFTSHPQIPRLQLHDRNQNRSRSESLSSPLRTSMSYGGADGRDTLSQSMHNSPLAGNDSNGSNGLLPYGLGYSYSSIPGFQATSNSRMRSFSNNSSQGLPRRIELGQNNNYQPNRNAPTSQNGPFSHYTSSPMTTGNNFSMMSAPHHVTSFPGSNYMRQDGNTSESFPSVDSLIGDNDSNHNGDNNDNNDGSIPSLSNF